LNLGRLGCPARISKRSSFFKSLHNWRVGYRKFPPVLINVSLGKRQNVFTLLESVALLVTATFVAGVILAVLFVIRGRINFILKIKISII
jgi:hypothetical protein